MKIVILDYPRENPGEIDWSEFDKYGEVRKYAGTAKDEVAERIKDADVVFLNKTTYFNEQTNSNYSFWFYNQNDWRTRFAHTEICLINKINPQKPPYRRGLSF